MAKIGKFEWITRKIYDRVKEEAWPNADLKALYDRFRYLVCGAKLSEELPWITIEDFDNKLSRNCKLTINETIKQIAINLLDEGKKSLLADKDLEKMSAELIIWIDSHLWFREITLIWSENLASDFMNTKRIEGIWKLSQLKIEAVWGENFWAEHMWIWKIMQLRSFSEEKILAIRGKNIADRNMTDDKFALINSFSIEEIKKLWGDNLPLISYWTLMQIGQKTTEYFAEGGFVELMWPKWLKSIDLTTQRLDILLNNELEKIRLVWVENVLKSDLTDTKLSLIFQLATEQIEFIWWDILVDLKMTEEKITDISENYALDNLAQFWKENLLDCNIQELIAYNPDPVAGIEFSTQKTSKS